MILGWYLLGQIVAWCCLPLTSSVFRHLDDRGYSARHAFGLLTTGFLLWIGAALGPLSNDRQGAFVALGGTLLLSLLAMRGAGFGESWTRLRRWLSDHWHLVLIHEGLFLVAFLGWCWFRMQDPAINHTEQPMDLMLLAGVLADEAVPPQDPWLSGYPVGYYYFGYWLQASLAQLVGARPEIAYNLAQAWWLAMVWSGGFGVVFNLLATSRRRLQSASEPGPDRASSPKPGSAPVLAGLLGAFCVAGAANLDGTLRALRHLAGSAEDSGRWWWFRSSRVVVDGGPEGSAIEVITEFPAFSFILGDNHPHLLALPFVLLAVAVAWNLWQAAPSRASTESREEDSPAASRFIGWSALRRIGRRLRAVLAESTCGPPWTAWLVVALVAGAPLPINTWDLPLVWLLLALPAWATGVSVLQEAQTGASGARGLPVRRVLFGLAGVSMLWAALTASTLVLFLPYLLTAQSQARGWLPNLLYPTSLWHFLLTFGGFLPAAGALLIKPRDGVKADQKLTIVVAGAILAGCGAVLMLGTLWAQSAQRGREWLAPYLLEQGAGQLVLGRWLERPFVLLGLTAFLAIATTRRWRLGDSTQSHSREPHCDADRFALILLTFALGLALLPELAFLHDVFSTRLNTVFKFYYQAWLLVALASAYAVVRFRSGAGLRTLLARVGLLLLLISSVYPIAALDAKRAEGAGPATLDGLAYLGTDERAAIEWIRRWTGSREVILQAPGTSYRPEHSRASSATGRATLLGWRGHEVQWRGARFSELAAGREAAAETVYRTGTADDIEQAIARFSIDYIYLGPVERQRYGVDAERERLLASLAETVFSQGDIRILRPPRVSPSDV